MSDFTDPNTWESFSTTPPVWWEAVAADEHWWFLGDVLGTPAVLITALDPQPAATDLIIDWVVQTPLSLGNYTFRYYTSADLSEFTDEAIPGTPADTGQFTILSGTTVYAWSILAANNPQLYSGLIGIQQEPVEVEEDEPANDKYYLVKWKSPEDFIQMCNARDPNATNVQITQYGPDDVSLTVYTDRAPAYWTSIDDNYILFDSYNSDVESSIVANKTQVYVSRERGELTLLDEEIVDLPSNVMSYFMSKLLTNAYAQVTQQINPKAEQRESRTRTRSQRAKWRQGRLNHKGPNFGR